MKLTHFLPLFLVFITACDGNQDESSSDFTVVKVEVHPVVEKAMQSSLYADRVNWAEVNARFEELVKQDAGQLNSGLQYLINSLGDEHATIRSAKDYSIVAFYTGERSEEDNRVAEYVDTVINDVSAQFSYQLLEDGVGYLNVVGIGAGDVKTQADDIRNGLIELKSNGIDEWILDLRFNGGGNMEPMLSGLAPLLGDGYVGGAVDRRNESTRQYVIEGGQFFNSERLVCPMDDAPKIDPSEKVAVLLSRYTASSGELVAVAFKGRPHTRFFGEETAGYTTGTGYEPLNEEFIMLISEDLFVDRNQIKYEPRVGVDVHMEFEPGATLANDPQVVRALEWLKG